jgi:hypothetical protein
MGSKFSGFFKDFGRGFVKGWKGVTNVASNIGVPGAGLIKQGTDLISNMANNFDKKKFGKAIGNQLLNLASLKIQHHLNQNEGYPSSLRQNRDINRFSDQKQGITDSQGTNFQNNTRKRDHDQYIAYNQPNDLSWENIMMGQPTPSFAV